MNREAATPDGEGAAMRIPAPLDAEVFGGCHEVAPAPDSWSQGLLADRPTLSNERIQPGWLHEPLLPMDCFAGPGSLSSPVLSSMLRRPGETRQQAGGGGWLSCPRESYGAAASGVSRLTFTALRPCPPLGLGGENRFHTTFLDFFIAKVSWGTL